MTKRTTTYSGLLCEHTVMEDHQALFLSSAIDPLAKAIGWISRRTITVRYWTSEQRRTREQIQEDALLEVMGVGDQQYGARYSEITGYLWTDEELNVGNHNLIDRL